MHDIKRILSDIVLEKRALNRKLIVMKRSWDEICKCLNPSPCQKRKH